MGAVQIAFDAASEIARPNAVGDPVGVRMVADRVAMHQFECLDPGYPGWLWSVSLSRAPRSEKVVVCELDLLPGEGALLAPEWVPWQERLQPADVSRKDVLPYKAQDDRLMSGFEQSDEGEADATQFDELGLGRERVLSPVGLDEAAKRWYKSERGPENGPSRQAVPAQATCGTCGFLIKLHGSMGSLFGVCANEWSTDDGSVVSYDHACGSHSETDVKKSRPQWPVVDSRLDDYDIATYKARRSTRSKVHEVEAGQEAEQIENQPETQGASASS